jgi:hypothetical protein
MNYTELTATIQDYCENTFTATELATFVNQTEQRIYNMVQFPALRKNVTGTLTAGNKYLSLPTDWLSTYSIAIYSADYSTPYTYLLNKDVNFIRESYPVPTTTGTPAYYSIFGPTYTDNNELTVILGPTPDANYQVELHYFFYPESIVTAGTSWLGDNFDAALLYGSLVEAITFMKGEADMVQLYNQKYMEAMALLKTLAEGRERSDSYRDGQTKLNANIKGNVPV